MSMTSAILSPSPVRSSARHGQPLHVVLIDEELPYPPISGKRIRTLNLAQRLGQRHRLTLLCHRNVDEVEAETARAYFFRQGIETVVVDRVVPRKSGLGFYARLGLNLLSSLPYSVATHDSKAMRQVMLRLASAGDVDLWQCEWTPHAHALRCLPNARRLVSAQNVESLIWQRYYETEQNPLKRWYIGKQWRKFQQFERRVLQEMDATVVVSHDDAALLRNDFGVKQVHVVDNGVDLSFFCPSEAQRQPNRLLFLGSLDWRPNLDALDQFLTHVFPPLRRTRPTVECAVVGRNPSAALKERIEGIPGVSLHANVADVRPFLAESALMVVPLRIGGGSRLKILEALAMGLPVVSTRVGAEGLCVSDGRHLTLCDGIDDMAGAVLSCLRQPGAALARAAEGRRLVCERYGWDALADRLEEIWWEMVQ
jgi:glycosyltransferase involved in cell wall biosynthesis